MRNALDHRLAPVALPHDRRGQRVIAGLAVRPQPAHRRHHQREQRRQQRLQQVADEEVLLPRLADDGGRIDRVAPPGEPLDLEHRVVVLQRVVAVVIAERPLRLAHVRADTAHQRELGVGDQRVRAAAGDERQARARDQRRQHQLRHVLGQRRDGRQDQRRRSAEEHRDRQVGAARLRRRVVEAAALADLPVQAGAAAIVHVEPVHAEVVPGAIRRLGVDERQRHERAAVLRPARDDRQLVEADVVGDDVDDRPVASPPQPDPRQIAEEAARPPQLRRRRRQDRLGGVHELFDQRVRARPEGQAGAARRPEQVRDQRKARAADVREQQRRPAGGNHAAMDLGGFLVGVDGSGDLDQVAIAPQTVEEGSEIGEASGHRSADIMDRGSRPGPRRGCDPAAAAAAGCAATAPTRRPPAAAPRRPRRARPRAGRRRRAAAR